MRNKYHKIRWAPLNIKDTWVCLEAGDLPYIVVQDHFLLWKISTECCFFLFSFHFSLFAFLLSNFSLFAFCFTFVFLFLPFFSNPPNPRSQTRTLFFPFLFSVLNSSYLLSCLPFPIPFPPKQLKFSLPSQHNITPFPLLFWSSFQQALTTIKSWSAASG